MSKYWVRYLVFRRASVEADSFEEACRLAKDAEDDEIVSEAGMCVIDTETLEFYERFDGV